MQLFLGIVDQHGQLDLLLLRQLAAERLADLAADRAGGVPQDMVELFVGAVNIGNIVIGAFG
jgi:hypothetical protein